MKAIIAPALATIMLALAGPAGAWGDLGHEVVAKIAYLHLTPATKAKVDRLLASDTDPLTAPDIASRATWADRYRNAHRETAPWHFVDIEIDQPDLDAACFGHPRLRPGQASSLGPSQDCVVDKINGFAAELRDPSTPQAERLLALKFVLHFMGDLHQPLHASDHHDRGGNCIRLSPSPDGRVKNLHAFWDTTVVEALGSSADDIATKLNAQISPDQRTAWHSGDASAWAMEAFAVAQKDVYALPLEPICSAKGSVELSPTYQTTAEQDAALQLERGGVRLAWVLENALGSATSGGAD